MMRVVVDGIVYALQEYGGINTYFNQLLPRLARRTDTQIDLFVPRRLKGRPPRSGIRWLPRDFVPSSTGVSARVDRVLEPVLESLKLAGIWAWASCRSPALFHSSYFTSLPASMPSVAMVHDMNHEMFPEFYADSRGTWLRERYPVYLRNATRIVAVSENTKRLVVQYYALDPASIDVVYHAVDAATFYVEPTEGDAKGRLRKAGIRSPYVLYVGGRWHYKNFSLLLDAMTPFHQRHGFSLVVAGAPWDARERAEIPRHPAAAAVTLVPFPTDELLRTLYNQSHAFVFPSLHEGFGIPLLEAMACGTPVLAADTEVFREVAGSAAIYFNPHDPEDLLRALECCLDEPTRQVFRARGLDQVALYSWDATAARTLETYRRTLALAS